MTGDPHAESLALPAAWIDDPGPGPVAPGDRVQAAGWALDRSGPLDTLFVLVDGEVAARTRLGQTRADLRAHYPDVAHAASAGWSATIDLSGHAGSNVELRLLARRLDGSWLELAGSTIQVRAGQSGRRGRAVFTIAQNEPRFLPLWVGYYRRHFAPDDIYVLDHDSTDGSAAAIAGLCNVVPVHRAKSFDHGWLLSTVSAFQAFLLKSYDFVLFSEVDEFVVADPAGFEGLADYIARLDRPGARCTGFNVVHRPGEPPLSFEQPILYQRKHWYPAPWYCKRLLASTPSVWSAGFHVEWTCPEDPPDPGLLLLHLHRVDFDYCLDRHRAAAARDWDEHDLQANDGWQNRIVDPTVFREWFYHGADLGSEPPQQIPELLRSVL